MDSGPLKKKYFNLLKDIKSKATYTYLTYGDDSMLKSLENKLKEGFVEPRTMKTYKQLIAEVAQPIPQDEKKFKDKHKIEKSDHPVAADDQFTGDTKKDKSRKADLQKGEDEKVYEATNPKNPKTSKDVENSDEYKEFLKNRGSRSSNHMKSIKKIFKKP